jgi:hypothetical protein
MENTTSTTLVSKLYNKHATSLCIDRYNLIKKHIHIIEQKSVFLDSLTDNNINTICSNISNVTPNDIDNADISLIYRMEYLLPRPYLYDIKCANKVNQYINNCAQINKNTSDCKILVNLRKLCSWNGRYPFNLNLRNSK